MKLKRFAAGFVAAVMAFAVLGTPLGDILPFVRESVATILSLAEKDGAHFLSQSEETWTNNIKWMLDTGVITKSVDAKDMIVKLVD